LPVYIKAALYSKTSGVQTSTTNDFGGGSHVTNINPGTWLSYSNYMVNIPATGTYKVIYRLASTTGAGTFTLVDEATSGVLDNVQVPKTAAMNSWIDVEKSISLTQGLHSFKIVSNATGFNFNWFTISANGQASKPNTPLLLLVPGTTSGSGSVLVSWGPSAATSCYLLENKTNNVDWTPINVSGSTCIQSTGVNWAPPVTTDPITHLQSGYDSYYFRVSACNSVGCSLPKLAGQIKVNDPKIDTSRRVIYIHTDLLGSPSAETDQNGKLIK
jgi:hypothetical protein